VATLKLPVDPRTAVFRALVRTLKSDPVLNREIKNWLVWDGPVKSNLGLSAASFPSIRLTPSIGQQSWYTPDSNIGPLIVKIEIDVNGEDADDYLNLWGCIERALYPADRTRELAIEQTFRDAGAETGQWTFTTPAQDPNAGNPEPNLPPQWNCIGMMQIQVIRTIRS